MNGQRSPRSEGHVEPKTDGDDPIWRALSDTSRRRMLDLLRQSSMTTGELCRHFEFSRFAVMKHLKSLERANLIVVERRGRERINHLNPVPIQAIYRRWIRPFDRLGDLSGRIDSRARTLHLDHAAEVRLLPSPGARE